MSGGKAMQHASAPSYERARRNGAAIFRRNATREERMGRLQTVAKAPSALRHCPPVLQVSWLPSCRQLPSRSLG